MATITRFEEIQAWQKARILVREVYQICRIDPLSKDFELRRQIQRAAISIMSNIAEGFGRQNSARDFAHFLDIARGSALEVQSLLYVTLDAGYITDDQFHHLYHLADENIALIIGFTAYLRNPSRHHQPI